MKMELPDQWIKYRSRGAVGLDLLEHLHPTHWTAQHQDKTGCLEWRVSTDKLLVHWAHPHWSMLGTVFGDEDCYPIYIRGYAENWWMSSPIFYPQTSFAWLVVGSEFSVLTLRSTTCCLLWPPEIQIAISVLQCRYPILRMKRPCYHLTHALFKCSDAGMLISKRIFSYYKSFLVHFHCTRQISLWFQNMSHRIVCCSHRYMSST